MRTPLVLALLTALAAFPHVAADHDGLAWSRTSRYVGGTSAVGEYAAAACPTDLYEPNVACVKRTLPPLDGPATLTVTAHDALYDDTRFFLTLNRECVDAAGHDFREGYGSVTLPVGPGCSLAEVYLLNRATTGDLHFVVTKA
jgi:hypothetical protein